MFQQSPERRSERQGLPPNLCKINSILRQKRRVQMLPGGLVSMHRHLRVGFGGLGLRHQSVYPVSICSWFGCVFSYSLSFPLGLPWLLPAVEVPALLCFPGKPRGVPTSSSPGPARSSSHTSAAVRGRTGNSETPLRGAQVTGKSGSSV